MRWRSWFIKLKFKGLKERKNGVENGEVFVERSVRNFIYTLTARMVEIVL